MAWITTSFNCRLPQCVCTHPINPMGIYLLCCTHNNKHIRTHDVVFPMIAWDADFHVGWKQLHVFLSTTFNSSCQWINIVLTKDKVHTLANVVIVDQCMWNLLPQSYAIQRFVTFDTIQTKERSYHNQHPINQFLPLTIKVFECLQE
jgi:hypothetical protein